MGAKLGYNGKNNGWCTFDNVRIPRTNMLMRYAKVDREGNFSIQGDIRILYIAMSTIRVGLLDHSADYLSRGLTIGLRYSAIRRQFKNNL